MQLESLKIFCDVVRWGSISRGGRENGISQSSASQVVHQIEARLGVKLIDRSKRPLVPTPQGRVYYEGCKGLIGGYLEVENRVKALGDERALAGTVRVAAIYSVGLGHMSRHVERVPGAAPRRRGPDRLPPPRGGPGQRRAGRGRPRPDLVPQALARADDDPLARRGDGPRRPPLAPVRRARPGRGRAARRRNLRRLRPRPADPEGRRPVPQAAPRPGEGFGRVRQHRYDQAGRRGPLGRGDPPLADAARARSGPARSVRSGSPSGGRRAPWRSSTAGPASSAWRLRGSWRPWPPGTMGSSPPPRAPERGPIEHARCPAEVAPSRLAYNGPGRPGTSAERSEGPGRPPGRG